MESKNYGNFLVEKFTHIQVEINSYDATFQLKF